MDVKTYLNEMNKALTSEIARLYLFREIDSTNTYAKTLQGETPAIVVAAKQTAGRGRRQKQWDSAGVGEDLYISYYVPCKDADLQGLTLVVALAVHDALEGFGVQTNIKWPNDIYVDDKKLCGILCEAIYHGGAHEAVVIGIGINGRKTPFIGELSEKATSLAFVKEEEIHMPAVAKELTITLQKKLALFFAEGFAPMLEMYTKHSLTLQKKLTVAGKEGVCIGFSAEGSLLLQTKQGIEEIVFGTPMYL